MGFSPIMSTYDHHVPSAKVASIHRGVDSSLSIISFILCFRATVSWFRYPRTKSNDILRATDLLLASDFMMSIILLLNSLQIAFDPRLRMSPDGKCLKLKKSDNMVHSHIMKSLGLLFVSL